MAKHQNRLVVSVAVTVAVVGSVLAASVGVPIYLRALAAPVHPQPDDVSSVTRAQPAQSWSASVNRARQIVRAGISGRNLPGVSVAVGVGGGSAPDIVWAEGFGWADVEARVPVTPETRFTIGTASTLLTSAAAGLLLEQGKLQLDEEIQSAVPQGPTRPWPITLRQVMGHTAGLGTDDGDEGRLFRQRCERPVEALPHFADRQRLSDPGTQYRYSRYDWILASAAIEAAADQPFMTFMREQVFTPLGMAGTGAESSTEENPEDIGGPGEDAPPVTFVVKVILEPLGIITRGPAPERAPDWATAYVPRSDADPRSGLRLMLPHNLSCYAGAMAFFSTPSDLVRFGLAMDGGTLLQPGTVQLLQASQPLTSGRATGHGLGWDRTEVTLAGRQVQAVGADGESRAGQVASLLMLPDRGLVVAVLSNVAHADTAALARQVAEAFATADEHFSP